MPRNKLNYTYHAYHVQVGNWQREHRGIFRLTQFPIPKRSGLILWSLWSRNREDHAQSVYSHQTALSIYDLSNLMLAKLHMAVPRNFRRSADIPSILVLYYDDLSADEMEGWEGYRVTRPIRTILDVSYQREVSAEILSQVLRKPRRTVSYYHWMLNTIVTDCPHFSLQVTSVLAGTPTTLKASHL